jgi:hypothetical protein
MAKRCRFRRWLWLGREWWWWMRCRGYDGRRFGLLHALQIAKACAAIRGLCDG